MSAKEDGGPAFPQPLWSEPGEQIDCPWFGYGMGGMSLRDWLAGMAMLGIWSGDALRHVSSQAEKFQLTEPAVLSQMAYAQADAMLMERNK